MRNAKETQVAVNREKGRETDNNILFNNLIFPHFCVASCNNKVIFVGFSLKCLESLGFL